ncbi:MAG: M56 family metallopeptidase, partial [Phycisphaerales bacterium]
MTELLELVSASGRALIGLAWTLNGYCLALLLAALVLDRVLAGRVGPGWRIALYLVVFARLAVPVSFTSPVRALLPVAAASTAPEVAAPLFVRAPLPGTDPAGSEEPVSTRSAAPAVDWLGVAAAGVYGAGVVMLLCAWMARHRRLARAVAGCEDARAEWAAMLPGIRTVEHATLGPLVMGTLRPTVVLSRAVLGQLGASEAHRVLRHERAHVQRGDHLLAPALLLIAIVAWPVVGVWVALLRVRALMEQACDAAALEGATRDERLGYGRVLLCLASGPAPSAAGAGVALSFATGVRGRLRALALPRPARPVVQFFAVAPLCAVLLACAGKGSSVKDNPEPSEKTGQPPESAAAEPTLRLGFRMLDGWPNHPKFEWQVKQTGSGSGLAGEAPPTSTARVPLLSLAGTSVAPSEAERDPTHTLSAAEVREVLEKGGAKVISAPTLVVRAGQPATIRVGEDDAKGTPVNGVRIQATAVLGPGGVFVDFDFEEFGPPTAARSARGVRRFLAPGETAAHLVPGLIGGGWRVRLVTAERVTEDGAAQPKGAGTVPSILYMV